jgi:hypothetical protein
VHGEKCQLYTTAIAHDEDESTYDAYLDVPIRKGDRPRGKLKSGGERVNGVGIIRGAGKLYDAVLRVYLEYQESPLAWFTYIS